MSVSHDRYRMLAWAAFEARDRTRDGGFVGAVQTTGIYCKPCCPARHPKRENVEFFATARRRARAGFAPACAAAPTRSAAMRGGGQGGRG